MSRLQLELPEAVVDELVERVAERAAAIVLKRLDSNDRSPSPYLSVDEAAQLLRSRRQRVYDLLSSGRLTRFKDGSRVLVSRDEIAAYLAGDAAGRRGPSVAHGSGNGMARRVAR
jgi:excisionase family DNA binding protein